MDPALADLLARYRLEPLPGEGGWFRVHTVSNERDASGRPLASAIHFVVADAPEGFSALHRLATPEVWHWREGAPVELLRLFPDGTGQTTVLGPATAAGQVGAVLVPGGVWQGARALGAWARLECTMAPAWIEAEFALGSRADLAARWPAWTAAIARLTRG